MNETSKKSNHVILHLRKLSHREPSRYPIQVFNWKGLLLNEKYKSNTQKKNMLKNYTRLSKRKSRRG